MTRSYLCAITPVLNESSEPEYENNDVRIGIFRQSTHMGNNGLLVHLFEDAYLSGKQVGLAAKNKLLPEGYSADSQVLSLEQ